jgi:2-alkyl-3-oxoalkanoate reductase
MMRRVLVTGATGFVGGRIVRRLRERDVEVRALVRTPNRELAELGVEQQDGGLDAIAPTLLEDVDAVVHAAATTGPELDDARVVNRDGTQRLCEAALAAGVSRFVHVSTTAVYDLEAVGNEVVTEDAPVTSSVPRRATVRGSVSPYAMTKAEAEAEVATATARGLSTAVLRPPAVLGAGPSSTWGTRVPRRLLDGRFPARPTETTFGWVHVDDLVDAVLAALESDATLVANVVGGHTTLGRYLEAVAELLPAEVTVPSSDEEPWTGRYDDRRLPEVLGVHPERSFESALAEIAASWRSGEVADDGTEVARPRPVADSRRRSSRRIIPQRLSVAQRERLRYLLADPDTWVLRPGWEAYLLRGDHAALERTDLLNTDHRVAALAWLRQQRHALYRALEGGDVAPDGWLESLPIVARLLELAPDGVRDVAER